MALGELTLNIRAGIVQFQQDLNAAKSGVQEFAQSTATFIEGNTAAFHAAGAALTAFGAAVTVGLGSAISSGADFEQAMSGVQAVTHASGESMERLSALAIQMGQDSAFSATQSAEAMTILGQAGFNTEEIIASLPGTLALAAAGQLDLSQAADIASSTIRGFGLETSDAAHVADVLALAATSANQTVGDLGTSFSYVAPIASSLGISMEDTGAAISQLANAGLDASTAGTSLRQLLSEMVSPSEQAAEAMANYGIQLTDAEGGFIGLIPAIQEFENANLSAEQTMEIFGVRSAGAMNILTSQGVPALTEFSLSLQAADGNAQEMSDTLLNNLNGSLTLLDSSIETFSIALSGPLMSSMQGVIDAIIPIINAMTEWMMNNQALTGILAGLAGAVGVVTTAVGAILLVLPTLLSSFAAISTAVAALGGTSGIIAGLGAALTVLTGPIGITVAAIAGLTAAWIMWGDDITAATEWAINTVIAGFNAWVSSTNDTITAINSYIGTSIPTLDLFIGQVDLTSQAQENLTDRTEATKSKFDELMPKVSNSSVALETNAQKTLSAAAAHQEASQRVADHSLKQVQLAIDFQEANDVIGQQTIEFTDVTGALHSYNQTVTVATQELSLAHGEIEGTNEAADTLQGAMAELGDSSQSWGSIFNTVAAGIRGETQNTSNFFQAATGDMENASSGSFSTIGSIFASLTGQPIRNESQGTSNFFQGAMGDMQSSGGSTFGALASLFGSNFVSPMQGKIGEVDSDFNSSGGLWSRVRGGFQETLMAMINHFAWGNLFDKFDNMNDLSHTVFEKLSDIDSRIPILLEGLGLVKDKLFGRNSPSLADIFDYLGDHLGISGGLRSIGDSVGDWFLSHAPDSVMGAVSMVTEGIFKQGSPVGDILRGTGSEALSSLLEGEFPSIQSFARIGFGQTIDRIGQAITLPVSSIMDILQGRLPSVESLMSDIISWNPAAAIPGFITLMVDIFGGFDFAAARARDDALKANPVVKQRVQGAMGLMKGGIGALGKQYSEQTLTLEQATAYTNWMINNIQDQYPGILGVFEGFPSASAWRGSFLNTVASGIAAGYADIPGLGGYQSSPDLPGLAFAEPGIVLRPFRGMVQMAENEPEFVSPISKIGQALDALSMRMGKGSIGGGRSVNINLNVQTLDVASAQDDLERLVRKRIIPIIKDESEFGTNILFSTGIQGA